MNKPLLIIDGYNLLRSVIRKTSRSDSLNLERHTLLKLIDASEMRSSKEIIVIFDGSASAVSQKTEQFGKIKVIFSDKNHEADDLIKNIIREQAHKKKITVVTSDRDIIYTAKDHGVKIEYSNEFWNKIKSDGRIKKKDNFLNEEREKNISDQEVKEWLDIFKNRTNGKKKD